MYVYMMICRFLINVVNSNFIRYSSTMILCQVLEYYDLISLLIVKKLLSNWKSDAFSFSARIRWLRPSEKQRFRILIFKAVKPIQICPVTNWVTPENSVTIFFIKIVRTVVFIFFVIFTTFRPMCPSTFFWCFMSNSGAYTELRTGPSI